MPGGSGLPDEDEIFRKLVEGQKDVWERYRPEGKLFTKEEIDLIIAKEMAKHTARIPPETDRSCLERIFDKVWDVQQSSDRRSIFMDQDDMRVSFHFDGDGSLTSIEMED